MEQPVESYHIMGQNQKEANQTMLYKGNTGYLKCVIDHVQGALGLITVAS